MQNDKNQRYHFADRVRTLVNTVLCGRQLTVSLAAISVLFLALAGIFVLPWHVAVPFSLSDSYAVGFNNLVAQVTFPIAVLALAVCLARFARGLFSIGTSRAIRLSGVAVSRCDFLAIGGALLLQYGFILFLWWLPTTYYSDGGYFVNRAEAWFQGNSPYWDVEYSHGIIFLAPIVLVGRILHCVVAEIRTIYYVYLAIWATLSILSVHWVLRRLSLARGERLVIFCTLAIFFVAETGGINAYPLRHLWPFLCLLILGSRAAVIQRQAVISKEIPLICLASLLLALSLFIGPEIFLVCAVTIPVFFFARFLLAGRASAFVGAGCTASLGCVLLILSKSFFAGTSSQIAGDLNFPVYPSPLVVFYLFCFATVIVGILLSFGAGRLSPGQEVLQSRNMALGFGMAVMSFGALSRADTGHVVQYGLLALVAAPAFLHGKARKTALIGFVVLVLAAKALMAGIVYAPLLFRATLTSPHISDDRFAAIQSLVDGNRLLPANVKRWIVRADAMRGQKNNLDKLLPEGFNEKILVPQTLNDATEVALRKRALYRHPYIMSSVDAMFQKPQYYQRLLQETTASRWLLLSKDMLWPTKEEETVGRQEERANNERLMLSAICMFPPAHKRNPIPSYLEDYRAYVLKHFSIVSQASGIILLQNKGN